MGLADGLKGGGGCNDLIFSGHGVTNMIFILVYRDYYHHNKWVYRFLLANWVWFAIGAIFEGHHYTVDLVLAGPIAVMVWDTYGHRAMSGPCNRATRQTQHRNELVPLPIRFLFLLLICVILYAALFIGA